MNLKVTLYTRTGCSYCDLAKEMLKTNSIQYEEKLIGTDVTREEVLDIVEENGINSSLPVALLNNDGQISYHNYTSLLDTIQGLRNANT